MRERSDGARRTSSGEIPLICWTLSGMGRAVLTRLE